MLSVATGSSCGGRRERHGDLAISSSCRVGPQCLFGNNSRFGPAMATLDIDTGEFRYSFRSQSARASPCQLALAGK